MTRKKAPIGAVLVMGGGVGGIQSSLELAGLGYKVYLLDSSPSVGGVMGMLDKTFPTNECSMCILSPKMVEIASNENVEVITLADVLSVQGKAGDFKVKVRVRPRFVDAEKCTGCGDCTAKCPAKIPDPYNAGLSMTKSIRVPFPQAVPGAAVIDPDTCRFLTKGKCGNCVKVCQAKAIDFEQKEEERILRVGAVIAAPGYKPFDASRKTEYGYKVNDNVITSLEFERILGANGPTLGHVVRPSDGEEVKKLAFIQCVGSRDTTTGNSYCSSVCCMYATKQALIAKEHLPSIEPTIFFIDMRAYGKDFEKYYKAAETKNGVRYIRGLVSGVRERQRSKDLLLRYLDGAGEMREEEFDLVVLSIGLEAPYGLKEELGIETNEHGFAATDSFMPVISSREGILVCGAAQEPKDIPDTVTQATAAAGLVSQALHDSRGTLLAKFEHPPERDVSGEEPRVGAIICRCGSNIGGFVDVPAVVEYASKLPGVVFAEERIYACSQDAQEWIRQVVEEHKLNRLVVASCTPRTHQPLFRETLQSAGVNKYLFEMANIREHCSWVHMKEPEQATRKAGYLVKMAVEKARRLEPLAEGESAVIPRALVIGGGVAGMNAALNLAGSRFQVYLVEKDGNLGGLARNIRFNAGGDDVQAYLEQLIERVEKEELITVFTSHRVKDVSGFVGQFKTLIEDPEGRETFLEHGAVIVATGGGQYQPAEYLYGLDERVITQWQLEDMLVKMPEPLPKRVVMIQCVGSRDEERPYCSKVCCTEAVKNALALKKLSPESEVFVLYRDIRTYGFREDIYREAREAGVLFVRYEDGRQPRVAATPAGLRVEVEDANLGGETVVLESDLLVLSTGITANPDNSELAPMLKVPRNAEGFFLEAHMKLRPVDFATDGVFVCGLAHAPKSIEESVGQAAAAAARAESVLSKEKIVTEGIVAAIDSEICSGCRLCMALCPFEAISYDEHKNVVEVNSSLCKGCGTCTAVCSAGASRLHGFRADQIFEQIEAAASGWRE
ncbi:MAG: heterodisulfide reductase [Candidatus Solincola sediminis]|uniref:Heterodisulfide reductase n=1 Tax=Candidatus Solincola sediminis TaxID=1797199 RepID=A0A1F2WRG7_9ACTN|nr:MAG: heterodisulfide reductase [Candidatus Solincola sediminis]